MIRVLVANTDLEVWVGSEHSRKLKTHIATPQGDSLSPILFVIYLEAALHDLKTKIGPTTIMELIYADDIDFVSEEMNDIRIALDYAPEVFRKWFLKMNEQKTEFITVKRESKVTDEIWKRSRKVGSLLGDWKDVNRRKILSTLALKRLKSTSYTHLSNPVKVRLYNAFILPILLYNSGTWGTESELYIKSQCFSEKTTQVIIENTLSNKDQEPRLILRFQNRTIRRNYH
ncbi:uncharacterized protein LOC115228316 [Octopus sinensis]|uniref:Uncharacterized protein LOC115228316 n=1 Tax=Octopus sinensis TaxID=2607531 RepID=A0A6P7TSN0_9MOLL|nr:uncharacterized protein LOC115228316 [Octopus sinensis]